MKKRLLCIVLLLCVFQLPASAEGLRENEIMNIGVIVNNDNSIEIIGSTTKQTISPTRAILVFEEDDDPEHASAILTITALGEGQTFHKKWSGGTPLFSNERFYEYTDENGMLKPGRYFAVVTEYEGKREILTDRAYFMIPAIEQWWTPQPTVPPTPTPMEGPDFINLAAVVDPADHTVTIHTYTSIAYVPFQSVFSVYADGDPDPIYEYESWGNFEKQILSFPEDSGSVYLKRDGTLRAGRYYAVLKIETDEGAYLTSDRAYFTIPGEYIPFQTAKPTAQRTAAPSQTAAAAPARSAGSASVHRIAYPVLGGIICAELAVICYLAKKKK